MQWRPWAEPFGQRRAPKRHRGCSVERIVWPEPRREGATSGREIQWLIRWRPHTVERSNQVERVKSAIGEVERDGIPHCERPPTEALRQITARAHTRTMRARSAAADAFSAIS